MTTVYSAGNSRIGSLVGAGSSSSDCDVYDVAHRLVGKASGINTRGTCLLYDQAGDVVGKVTNMGSVSYTREVYDAAGRSLGVVEGVGRVSMRCSIIDSSGQSVGSVDNDGEGVDAASLLLLFGRRYPVRFTEPRTDRTSAGTETITIHGYGTYRLPSPRAVAPQLPTARPTRAAQQEWDFMSVFGIASFASLLVLVLGILGSRATGGTQSPLIAVVWIGGIGMGICVLVGMGWWVNEIFLKDLSDEV